ncbi:MAG: hypothetical protein ACOCP8_00905, partial [archaeon]
EKYNNKKDLENSLIKLNNSLKNYNNIKTKIGKDKEKIYNNIKKDTIQLEKSVNNLNNQLNTINILPDTQEKLEKLELENKIIKNDDKTFKSIMNFYNLKIKTEEILYDNQNKINKIIDNWMINTLQLSSEIEKLINLIEEYGGNIDQNLKDKTIKLSVFIERNNIYRENILQGVLWFNDMVEIRNNMISGIIDQGNSQLEKIISEKENDMTKLDKKIENLKTKIIALEKGLPYDKNREGFKEMIKYAEKEDFEIPITEEKVEEYANLINIINRKKDNAINYKNNIRKSINVNILINSFKNISKLNKTIENTNRIININKGDINMEYEKYNYTIDKKQNEAKKEISEIPHGKYKENMKQYYTHSEKLQNNDELYKSLIYATAIKGMNSDDFTPPSQIPPIAKLKIVEKDKNKVIVKSESYGVGYDIVNQKWKKDKNSDYNSGEIQEEFEYSDPGQYTISLKVIDEMNKENTTSKKFDLNFKTEEEEEEEKYKLEGIIQISPENENDFTSISNIPVTLNSDKTVNTNGEGLFTIKELKKGEYDFNVDLSKEKEIYPILNSIIFINSDTFINLKYDKTNETVYIKDPDDGFKDNNSIKEWKKCKRNNDTIENIIIDNNYLREMTESSPTKENNGDVNPPSEEENNNMIIYLIIGIIIGITIILIIIKKRKSKDNKNTTEEDIFDDFEDIE